MINKVSKNAMRQARHERIRKDIHGTVAVPRLSVYRSNSNIFAKLIDDENGITFVSASSIDKELKLENGGNIEAAKKVGADIAEKCKAANIETVRFDRGGYVYHGRVQALADAAREAGLKF